MASLSGTNVAAAILPFTTEDFFATHYAKYGNGGWQEVATTDDRDAITTARREAGMAVYVTGEGKLYILGSDLETWTVFETGKIDKIKVNGTEQEIVDKTVDITVPTKISDLTDDTATNPIDKADTLTDLTATVTELNVLDGITASTEELNYVDGVTSNIQTQLDSKQATLSAGTNITIEDNEISATDTTYSAGDGLTLNGTTFSANVQDNVTSTSTTDALSANMGKELNDRIDNLESIGKFLSGWDSATGLPTSNPTVSPYIYHTGDYFFVSNIDKADLYPVYDATATYNKNDKCKHESLYYICNEDGVTGEWDSTKWTAHTIKNFRPTGDRYTRGVASEEVESSEIAVGDIYLYDSTSWLLLKNTQKTVTFAQIAGNPSDNTALANALNAKANDDDVLHKTAGAETVISNSTNGYKTFNNAIKVGNPNNSTYSTFTTENTGELKILANAKTSGLRFNSQVVEPLSDNLLYLGSSSKAWKGLFLKGSINKSGYNFTFPSKSGTFALTDDIQIVQVSTMPAPSTEYNNKIVQYVGATTSDYTNGYFYKCTYSEIPASATVEATVGAEHYENFIVDVSKMIAHYPTGADNYFKFEEAQGSMFAGEMVWRDYGMEPPYELPAGLMGSIYGIEYDNIGSVEQENDVLHYVVTPAIGTGSWTRVNVQPEGAIYTAGTGLKLDGTEFSVDTDTIQEKLTAGNNITISSNNISAKDTTYSAGTNIEIIEKGYIAEGYKAIKYVESNGTGYINTNHKYLSTSVITMEAKGCYEYPTGEEGVLAGMAGTTSYENSAWFTVSGNKQAGVNMAGTGYIWGSDNEVEVLKIDIPEGKGYWNGNNVLNQNIIPEDLDVYLFARNKNNTPGLYAKGRIRSYVQEDGGVKVVDYHACIRESDNVVGFYDKVTNTFITCSGLTAGPDLYTDEYIINCTAEGTVYTAGDGIDLTDDVITNTMYSNTPSIIYGTDSSSSQVQYSAGDNIVLHDPYIQGLYQKIAYIESNGDAILDTGITYSPTDILVLDFQATEIQTEYAYPYYVFGTGYKANTDVVGLRSFANRFEAYEDGNGYGPGGDAYKNIGGADLDRHLLKIENKNIYLDNELKNTFTYVTESYTTVYNVALCGQGWAESSSTYNNMSKCKIYEFKLFNADQTLKAHFVPAKRLADNVIGMYDYVSNTFKASAIENTSFISGPADTQYTISAIDTTYTAGNGIDITDNEITNTIYSNTPSIIYGTDSQGDQLTYSEGNGIEFYDGIINNTYKKLEYVDSQGLAYINLGTLKPNQEDEYYCKFKLNTYPTSPSVIMTIFGINIQPNTYTGFGLRATSNTIKFAAIKAGDYGVGEKSYLADTNIHEVTVKDKTYTDGNISYTPTYTGYMEGDFTADFCLMNLNGNNITDGRLYAFYIKDHTTGNYIINIIPVKRLSDGVAGLYDTVSDTFYSSVSATAFLAGPEDTPKICIDEDVVQGTLTPGAGIEIDENNVISTNVSNALLTSINSSIKKLSTFEGYDRVSWMKSDGVTPFNLGVLTYTNLTTINMTWSMDVYNYSGSFFGCTNITTGCGMYISSNTIKLIGNYGQEIATINGMESMLRSGTIHTMTYEPNGRLYVDTEYNVNPTTSGFGGDFGSLDVYLFSVNRVGETPVVDGNIKIYGFSATRFGTPFINLYPVVRKSDSALGFLDSVTSTFYPAPANYTHGDYVLDELTVKTPDYYMKEKGAQYGGNNLIGGSTTMSIANRTNYSTLLGRDMSTTNGTNHVIAIGYNAKANANYAIQLGTGTNTEASSFYVALSDTNNYKLLGSTGIIPADRMADTTSATAGMVLKKTASGTEWASESGGAYEAGEGISITNNTITNTRQASGYHRGTFNTHADIPTTTAGYLPDPNGNTEPLDGDYIIILNDETHNDNTYLYRYRTTAHTKYYAHRRTNTYLLDTTENFVTWIKEPTPVVGSKLYFVSDTDLMLWMGNSGTKTTDVTTLMGISGFAEASATEAMSNTLYDTYYTPYIKKYNSVGCTWATQASVNTINNASTTARHSTAFFIPGDNDIHITNMSVGGVTSGNMTYIEMTNPVSGGDDGYDITNVVRDSNLDYINYGEGTAVTTFTTDNWCFEINLVDYSKAFINISRDETSLVEKKVSTAGGIVNQHHIVAMGKDAVSMDNYTTTIGASAYTSGLHAVALGHSSHSTGNGSVALGTYTTASNCSVSLGARSAASGSTSIAIGGSGLSSEYTKAEGTGSIAIGYAANAKNEKCIAIGYKTKTSTTDTITNNNSIIAIGNQLTASKPGNIFIGNSIYNNTDLYGYVTCVGTSLSTRGDYHVVLGHSCIANGRNNIAIGMYAQSGSNGIASLSSVRVGNVAIGGYSKALGACAVAIGGADVNGYDNAAQAMSSYSIAIGHTAKVNGVYSIAIGKDSIVNSGCNAGIAIGQTAKVNGYTGVAIGYNTQASGASVAIGTGTVATSNAVGIIGDAKGWGSVAIGFNSECEANSGTSVAIGYNAHISNNANESIQLGYGWLADSDTFQVWDKPIMEHFSGHIFDERLYHYIQTDCMMIHSEKLPIDGLIYQWTGTTNSLYTQGYFYKLVRITTGGCFLGANTAYINYVNLTKFNTYILPTINSVSNSLGFEYNGTDNWTMYYNNIKGYTSNVSLGNDLTQYGIYIKPEALENAGFDLYYRNISAPCYIVSSNAPDNFITGFNPETFYNILESKKTEWQDNAPYGKYKFEYEPQDDSWSIYDEWGNHNETCWGDEINTYGITYTPSQDNVTLWIGYYEKIGIKYERIDVQPSSTYHAGTGIIIDEATRTISAEAIPPTYVAEDEEIIF